MALRSADGPDARAGLEVGAEAPDGSEAVSTAIAEDVDLAILDISMPRMTGLDAAHELSRHRPDVRVLILSMREHEQYLYAALKAGVSGCVVKTVAKRGLVETCRAAMRGDPFLYRGR